MKSTVQRRKPGSTTVIKAFSKTRHRIDYNACHASENAVLLMEAHVHLSLGFKSRERLLLLFTDSLIIAKTKSLYLKMKACVGLSDVWMNTSHLHCVTDRKITSKNSFVIGWPTTNYVVTFSSSETKDRWFRALQWHTFSARQTILPTAIVLHVLLVGHSDDTDPTTVAVEVDVSTTAESVVQHIMHQYKLQGEVSSHQLWVNSEREEETFPLFGHELPFAIYRYMLRIQKDRLHVPSHCKQEAQSSLQQTEPTTKTLFTLKQRTHTPRGSLLKLKRKRSLIAWALRRANFNQSDGHSDPEDSSHKLFGQSLSSICTDGNLPMPILDLLYLLFCEGPETRGIFRRSANAKNCQILKDRINSGQSFSLHEESVFVSASLITEFLRKLPGGVLCSELYEEWMEVLQMEDKDKKLQKVRSLLARLPEENYNLLCHLFGVLQRIHAQSESNQMTASNLSLCIAPNMLWRSSQISPERAGQSVKEVAALIQMMIENTAALFGEDLESLFVKQMSSRLETRDSIDEPYLNQPSSSEDTDHEFSTSPQITPEVHPLFLPLAALALSDKKSMQIAHSCRTLGSISSHSDSLANMLGAGELGQSRNRCRSEPTMCSPQVQPLTHASVVRQSSYDASVTAGRGRAPHATNHGPGARQRRYAFWKSPQIPNRFRHPAQRLASLSSLSSTTTSSLSSLESTMSLTSIEPIPSPQDAPSRPFLFGAAARLRPLTPELSRKPWTSVFSYEEVNDHILDQQGRGVDVPHRVEFPAPSLGLDGEEATDNVTPETPEHVPGPSTDSLASPGTENNPSICPRTVPVSSGPTRSTPDTMDSTMTQEQVNPKSLKSTSHIQLTCPKASGGQKVSRMKITFFPSAGRVRLKQVRGRAVGVRKTETGLGVAQEAGVEDTVEVPIPQTLFYVHDVPPVLRSSPLQTSVQAQENVSVTGSGLCDAANDSTAKISNGLSGKTDGNKCQNVEGVRRSADSLPGSGKIPDSDDLKKLSPGQTDPTFPKHAGKTFCHTIWIKLPGHRGTAKNKP